MNSKQKGKPIRLCFGSANQTQCKQYIVLQGDVTNERHVRIKTSRKLSSFMLFKILDGDHSHTANTVSECIQLSILCPTTLHPTNVLPFVKFLQRSPSIDRRSLLVGASLLSAENTKSPNKKNKENS